MKFIRTVKGDKFYFGYNIYKLSTCRSGGIMYIQRLFLTIYDCFDPVGNLQPKKVVCRNSVSFVKQS
jgi:hypothetical protein